jgi:xanthine/uracil/vitamin C permease (AzgA family)
VGTIAVIIADREWIYPILTVALLASAWLAVTALMLVIFLAVFRVERRVVSLSHLEAPVIVSAIAGLFLIIGLAQLRFWLERTLGIPQDFMAAVVSPLGSILS